MPDVTDPISRRTGLFGLLGSTALGLSGCARPLGNLPTTTEPTITDGSFTMPDGFVLPYRSWMPEGPPATVILALHGFNDSRDGWEYPAPAFRSAGMAVYAPD